jgi:ABC-type sugar transport system ATPase subunit
MVGRDVEYQRQEAGREPEEQPILDVEGLTREPKFRDVSFALRRGEIVALAGLVGSGRTEVARAIAGIDRPHAGRMRLKGVQYSPRTPRQAIDLGVVYFSEDRKREGLILSMQVRENITLPMLDRFSSRGVVQRRMEAESALRVVREVDLRPPEIDRDTRTLSGGNQQKVVFAKGLLADADVLLMDEPTRGVDVGAKVELHRQIRGLADLGKAILVISSELPEVLALADRVIVLREGRVAGVLEGSGKTSEAIIALAVAAA